MKKILVNLCVIVLCGGLQVLAGGLADATFGSNGTVSAGFGQGNDYLQMTGVCADGSMIGLGFAGSGQGRVYALAKYTPQGIPDASFGSGGLVILPRAVGTDPAAMAVTPDCNTYIAGGFGADNSVGKYDANGDLAQVFNGGDPAPYLNGIPQALAVQSDGSVVVAGIQGSEYGRYAVYRYLATGALDTNFGVGGKSLVKMGWKGKPASVTFDGSGKVVVTGWAIPESVPTWDKTQSLIARYNFDGSLDTSFGNAGVLLNPVRDNSSEVYLKGVTLADGHVMAMGFSGGYYLISRFNADGSFDKYFGGRGHHVLALPGAISIFQFQNDGSAFFASNSKIFKFAADGYADRSFGPLRTPGVVTLTSNGNIQGISSMAIGTDGKLSLGGGIFKGSASGSNTMDFDYLFERLNANGTVDDSFDGDGIASRDAGDSPVIVTAVAQQADGKILIGGGRTNSINSERWGTGISRYNADGSVDASFADQGKLYLNTENSINSMVAIKVQPDGKIVAAGNIWYSGGIRLMRLNPDGTPDPSFGAGGVFNYPDGAMKINDILLQPDGKILIDLYNLYNFTPVKLARLNPDGTFDNDFGTGGLVISDIISYDNAETMALQPDGRIVVGGSCGSGQDNYDICVARYNPNGALDMGFGRRGMATTDLGTYNDALRSLTIAGDGSIVAAASRVTSSGLSVVRYTANGALDPTFGTGGIYNTTNFTFYSSQASVQVLGDNSVVLLQGLGNEIAIQKLTPAGVPDTGWAPNGLLNTGIYNTGRGTHSLLDAQGRLVFAGTGGSVAGYVARFNTGN
jgi:uncharacterized delta-60 repeat protein